MTPDPTTTIDHLYSTGAWFCLTIVLAFFALRWASTHVAWLEEDHHAVYVSAALGGLTLLVVPAAQGTTPNMSMILSALITVVALAANPKKPDKQAASRTPQAGFASPGVLLLIVSIGMTLHFGCGASARQKTLFATLATLDGAETGLVAFDQKYQDTIVASCRNDSACTEAIGHTRLVDYRAKRDTAVKAITSAYVVLGQAFSLDNDPSLKAALAAAAIVATQLSTLGVTP